MSSDNFGGILEKVFVHLKFCPNTRTARTATSASASASASASVEEMLIFPVRTSIATLLESIFVVLDARDVDD